MDKFKKIVLYAFSIIIGIIVILVVMLYIYIDRQLIDTVSVSPYGNAKIEQEWIGPFAVFFNLWGRSPGDGLYNIIYNGQKIVVMRCHNSREMITKTIDKTTWYRDRVIVLIRDHEFGGAYSVRTFPLKSSLNPFPLELGFYDGDDSLGTTEEKAYEIYNKLTAK